MLQYSDLTVVKNENGLPCALGIPINSFLMKNEMFSGGGGGHKKGKKEMKEIKEKYIEKPHPSLYDENLAVPMGLVCTTETVCRSAPAAQNVYDVNSNASYTNSNLDESDIEIVPESLYNNLLDLLNMPEPSKKMTRKGKRAAPAAKKTRRKNKKNK